MALEQGVQADPDAQRFLRRALFRLRWSAVALLLLVTFMQPAAGRAGVPTWVLVALFAGYNLVVELLRNLVPRLGSYTVVALLDLPVVGLLYGLGAEAGGPLFLLLFVAVDCAAVSMPLRAALFYTAAVAALAAGVDTALLMWAPTPVDARLLVARVAMLALLAVGMAFLTRRLVLEQEAARAGRDEAERLETLDRLRSDFIASVSHDLRTPLTAARAGVGLLELGMADRLQAPERDLLHNVRRNIERLHGQIDELLTFNQLESGTWRLDREPLDLRAVVLEALAAVHPLIQEKGQTLEVDIAGPLPFEGDVRGLEQVMVNLLANAHQHTPAGTRITLAGRVTADEVLLSVGDNGPGIPPAALGTIFERFRRLDPGAGGFGLGLAIAKAFAELHGGRIWVESRPGLGATFHIALPRHHGQQEEGGP